MINNELRADFYETVAAHKLKIDSGRSDKPLLVTGVALMAIGTVGTFVEWNASLAQDDARDIASSQILVLALLGLILVGSTLFLAASLARLLRFWLLRQLIEAQAQRELSGQDRAGEGLPDSP